MPDALVIYKTLSLSSTEQEGKITRIVWISLPVLPFTKWGFIEFFFQIRELVPESQAYMDLLAFERKLDQTIMRKRVDIQEALKRPMKVFLIPMMIHIFVLISCFRTDLFYLVN